MNSNPIEIAKVAEAFPHLIIVLAHIGKGFYEESVNVAKKAPNIFFDTSTCFFDSMRSVEENTALILNIINKVGTDRFMFGTDWPWNDPHREIAIIKAMGLSHEEKAKILGLTAKNIYKL
jgi:hypothetical protein